MPLTALDPATALILIDLQKGITGREAAHPVEDIVAKAASLAAAFRAAGKPVVLVNVAGMAPGRSDAMPEGGAALGEFPAEWTELAPELDVQPSDHLVTKRTWGAFVKTGLEDWLHARGVTQVVLAGISTSIGVESTARQAYEAGFNVTLATDAMTDSQRQAHDNSVSLIFPRLGETGTAADVIALLEGGEAR